MVQGQPNSHLVGDLCGQAQYLPTLHEMFCSKFTFGGSKVISIYETRDTQAVGVNIDPATYLLYKDYGVEKR